MARHLVLLMLWGVALTVPPENPNEFEQPKPESPPVEVRASMACEEPPSVEHATIDGTGPPYEEGTPLLYICVQGYYSDGSPYSRCIRGGWEGPLMACRPKSCGDPGYPTNGYRHSSDFTNGARVYFYCNEGYQLAGDSFRTCVVDDTWSMSWSGNLPNCEELKPTFEGSGEFQQVLTDKNLDQDLIPLQPGNEKDKIVHLRNEYDYDTIPSKSIDRDVFIRVNVKHKEPDDTTTQKPYVENSHHSTIYHRIVQGTRAKYDVTSSAPDATSHVTRSSGHVTNTNQNYTRIATTQAPVLVASENELDTSDDRNEVVAAGGNSDTLDTLVDIDDHDIFTIDSVTTPPESGSGSGSGYSSGDTIDEEIDVGVFSTSKHTTERSFSGFCGSPPVVEHTSHDGTGAPYSDGTILLYTCNSGYHRAGYPYIMCQSNQWSPPNVTCHSKSCGDPGSPVNGYTHGSTYSVGSHVFFNCNDGHTMIGNNYQTCQEDNQWSGNLPICRIVSCPDPGDITNGYRRGFVLVYGSKVFYYCNDGYDMSGPNNVTCESDQLWSTEPPTCHEKSCGLPGYIANGYHSGDDYTVGGRVFYYCEDGYEIIGDNYQYCQPNKQWSGATPACREKTCGDPGLILNGLRQVLDFSVGARVYFSCNPGYELAGPHYLTCSENQRWSEGVPQCIEMGEVIIDNDTDDSKEVIPGMIHRVVSDKRVPDMVGRVVPTVVRNISDDTEPGKDQDAIDPDMGSSMWPNSGQGSGFNFICDENTCKYGGICFSSAVDFQCVCNNTCPNSDTEITCGSDGHVYANPCEIRLASCRSQTMITSAPNQICKEISVDEMLPSCGSKTNEPEWSDWSLWIKSGNKDIRFRHCRSNKARADGRSHCSGPDIQTRLCQTERTDVCRSGDGSLGYQHRYKCKGVDGHDLPDSNEIYMGNNSYEDCWFSLFSVKNSKYKRFRWSFLKLLEEGNVKNWCHKRNQFIPFYPAHGFCEMALHYFCHSQSKCTYEAVEEKSKPDDHVDSCWTQFAYEGVPPSVFEDIKESRSVICQKFSGKSSFGTMFGVGKTHYSTLFDTRRRIPVFSMVKVERMSDSGWPVVPYLLERGLVNEGQFMSWIFSSPEKGLASQYELADKLRENLCKLGHYQALYDDYKLSGYRVGQLIVPELAGCHPSSKVATFALTNSVPMHLTQHYAWMAAMTAVKEYAMKKCGIHVERDHTGVYCQQPERVTSSLYLVSGAVASHDPQVVIGNNVNVPAMVWMAGCCVDPAENRIRSFGFYLTNKADFPVQKTPVSELETLITVMTYPKESGTIPFKIFPASRGICSSPQNDDTSNLKV